MNIELEHIDVICNHMNIELEHKDVKYFIVVT